jgi:hypothetical protein
MRAQEGETHRRPRALEDLLLDRVAQVGEAAVERRCQRLVAGEVEGRTAKQLGGVRWRTTARARICPSSTRAPGVERVSLVRADIRSERRPEELRGPA